MYTRTHNFERCISILKETQIKLKRIDRLRGRMVLWVKTKLAFVSVAHHDNFSIESDQSRVLVILRLACTDLSDVLKLPVAELFESIIAPTNRQIVMCESKSVIDATLHVLDGKVFENLLHVDI